MSLDTFMNKFGATEAPVATFASTPDSLDKFLTKFAGEQKSYWFYDNTIELRFDVDSHTYYLVGPLGELTALDGVTTVLKVIDKSNALVPWAAKKTVEKVLRLMPRVTKQEPVVVDTTAKDFIDAGSPTFPVEYVAEMRLEEFEKLLQEAKSAHKDILNDAGDVGHMAHTWLEYYVQACIAKDEQSKETKLLNLPEDPRAKNCCLAALKWMTAHNVRWLHTERKIYSKKYGYAGTLDGICEVDSCDNKACCPVPFKDRLTLSDWKSSNGLRLTYRYQCASYKQAIQEELNLPITDIWILRLGKEDGEFEPWHITEDCFQEDLAGFLDALSLTRSIKITEDTMRGQKLEAKAVVKELKEAAKVEEKAAKKLAREEAKAARKVERDNKREDAKAARKAERAALRVNGAQITEVYVDEAQYLPDNLLTPDERIQIDAEVAQQVNPPVNLDVFTPDVKALIEAALEAHKAEELTAQVVTVTATALPVLVLGMETGRTRSDQPTLSNTPKEATEYRDFTPDVPVQTGYGLPEEVVTGSR